MPTLQRIRVSVLCVALLAPSALPSLAAKAPKNIVAPENDALVYSRSRPDDAGGLLAYCTPFDDLYDAVGVMKVDGKETVYAPIDGSGIKPTRRFLWTYNSYFPQISPDGSKVLVVGFITQNTSETECAFSVLDVSAGTRLVPGIGSFGGQRMYSRHVEWSPDGKWIAFTVGGHTDGSVAPKETPAKLLTFELATGKIHEIDSNADRVPAFCWAPRESLLYGKANPTNKPSLITAGSTVISEDKLAELGKRPSVESSSVFSGRASIVECAADGSAKTMLLSDADDPGAVSPDGKWLVCNGWYGLTNQEAGFKSTLRHTAGEEERSVQVTGAFSPLGPGKWVPVTGILEKHMVLSDISGRKRYFMGSGQVTAPQCVGWSPSSEDVLVAEDNGLGDFRIPSRSWAWDKQLAAEDGGTARINGLPEIRVAGYSPDGAQAYLISGGNLKQRGSEAAIDRAIAHACNSLYAVDISTGNLTLLAALATDQGLAFRR